MVGGGGGGGGHGGGGGGGHGGGGWGGHGGGGGSHCPPACHCPSPGISVAPPIGSSVVDEEAPLLDESYQRFNTRLEYFCVCTGMLVCTVVFAYSQWPDWRSSLVTVITSSYSTATALLLVKHCNNKKQREAPQCAAQNTWVQMLVVTVVMTISIALAVSTFHNKWDDVAWIVFYSIWCATCSFMVSDGSTRDESD